MRRLLAAGFAALALAGLAAVAAPTQAQARETITYDPGYGGQNWQCRWVQLYEGGSWYRVCGW